MSNPFGDDDDEEKGNPFGDDEDEGNPFGGDEDEKPTTNKGKKDSDSEKNPFGGDSESDEGNPFGDDDKSEDLKPTTIKAKEKPEANPFGDESDDEPNPFGKESDEEDLKPTPVKSNNNPPPKRESSEKNPFGSESESEKNPFGGDDSEEEANPFGEDDDKPTQIKPKTQIPSAPREEPKESNPFGRDSESEAESEKNPFGGGNDDDDDDEDDNPFGKKDDDDEDLNPFDGNSNNNNNNNNNRKVIKKDDDDDEKNPFGGDSDEEEEDKNPFGGNDDEDNDNDKNPFGGGDDNDDDLKPTVIKKSLGNNNNNNNNSSSGGGGGGGVLSFLKGKSNSNDNDNSGSGLSFFDKLKGKKEKKNNEIDEDENRRIQQEEEDINNNNISSKNKGGLSSIFGNSAAGGGGGSSLSFLHKGEVKNKAAVVRVTADLFDENYDVATFVSAITDSFFTANQGMRIDFDALENHLNKSAAEVNKLRERSEEDTKNTMNECNIAESEYQNELREHQEKLAHIKDDFSQLDQTFSSIAGTAVSIGETLRKLDQQKTNAYITDSLLKQYIKIRDTKGTINPKEFIDENDLEGSCKQLKDLIAVVDNLNVEEQQLVEQRVQEISRYIVDELSNRFCSNLATEQYDQEMAVAEALVAFNGGSTLFERYMNVVVLPRLQQSIAEIGVTSIADPEKRYVKKVDNYFAKLKSEWKEDEKVITRSIPVSERSRMAKLLMERIVVDEIVGISSLFMDLTDPIDPAYELRGYKFVKCFVYLFQRAEAFLFNVSNRNPEDPEDENSENNPDNNNNNNNNNNKKDKNNNKSSSSGNSNKNSNNNEKIYLSNDFIYTQLRSAFSDYEGRYFELEEDMLANQLNDILLTKKAIPVFIQHILNPPENATENYYFDEIKSVLKSGDIGNTPTAVAFYILQKVYYEQYAVVLIETLDEPLGRLFNMIGHDKNQAKEYYKEIEYLFNTMCKKFGDEFINLPADIMIQGYKVLQEKDQAEPEYQLFEVIQRLIQLLSNVNKYYYTKIHPLVKSDQEVSQNCHLSLVNLYSSVEKRIVEMLTISMNTALEHVDGILLTGVKNKELSSPPPESINRASESCLLACSYLLKHVDYVSGILDGSNLQSYLYQLWIKFHENFLQNLIKTKTLSSAGVMLLGFNLEELNHTADGFCIEEVQIDYINLSKEIQLVLDAPDLIKTALQNDYLMKVKKSRLADLLRIRPDYKSNRTIRDIVSNLT